MASRYFSGSQRVDRGLEQDEEITNCDRASSSTGSIENAKGSYLFPHRQIRHYLDEQLRGR